MRRKITSAMGALILVLLLGYGTTSETRSVRSILRPATDVPERFEAPAGVAFRNNTCVGPLTDPRTGAKIIMQASFGEEGFGDYVVPSGLSGVGDRELLRINCRTGEVLGIVKR